MATEGKLDPKSKNEAFHKLFNDELKSNLEESPHESRSRTSSSNTTSEKKLIGGILKFLVEIPTGHTSIKGLSGKTSALTTCLYLDKDNINLIVQNPTAQSIITSTYQKE